MGINRKHLGDAGQDLVGYFEQLAARLRKVRVACGDWSRVMGDSVTVQNGLTGVFLDPPYASARNMTYAVDSTTVAHDVREWAIANGDNPMLRIALCGYEGEHNMPESWHVVEWKTQGGYGLQAQALENAAKERIWFSPHCIISTLCQQRLF
jgi:site-specific DNA-adenine methylase